MPKRAWNQVDGEGEQQGRRTQTRRAKPTSNINRDISSPVDVKVDFSHPPTPTSTDASAEPQSIKSATRQRAGSAHSDDIDQVAWPAITRKVKACAACRKQKIKCDMEDDNPPCKRCKERGLSCKLNKSLQTLIDEEFRWRKTVSHDLTVMHSALEQTLRALNLPSLPALHTPMSEMTGLQDPEIAFTRTTDSSPMQLTDLSSGQQLEPEISAHIPIESLYELTRLRSLRGETVEEQPCDHNDFISRGLISVDRAEELLQCYQVHLDPYIYGLASKYKSLETLRRSSSLLTACICTVAASHQAGDSQIYEICNNEFRRLISGSMFERRVSLDYIRALVIGSYWLSDVSWTMMGLAIRRASDINLPKYYNQIVNDGFAPRNDGYLGGGDSSQAAETAIDAVRLWYLLYICDQHLSILYTRAPMIREDETIRGWRAYLESSSASQADLRISSQLALMIQLSQVREFFGVDATKVIPRGSMPHINTFSHHLDKWLAYWSSKLSSNEHIGNFPSKGVLLHYHFGKLHLYSHVFRGLKMGVHIEQIPPYFKDAASTAVSHATTILELLLNDVDIRRGIVGVPYYFHTMISFACVVLLKVIHRYREDLNIDVASTHALIQQVIDLLRRTNCGRYHLVHWMADGLTKMLTTSIQRSCSRDSISTSSDSTNSSSSRGHPHSSHVSQLWNTIHYNNNNTTNPSSDGVGEFKSNMMGPSIVHHSRHDESSVEHALLHCAAEIPEQPSFLSLDPNYGNLVPDDEDIDPSMISASNGETFLSTLDGLDGGGEYGLTDLRFNFV